VLDFAQEDLLARDLLAKLLSLRVPYETIRDIGEGLLHRLSIVQVRFIPCAAGLIVDTLYRLDG